MTTLTECMTTPAGGGEISPASANRSTSLDSRTPGEVADVVEPPKQDDVPVEARSDEIDVEIFDWSLDAGAGVKESLLSDPDDDSDPHAYPRARRLICSASSDGQTTIHRFGDVGICLTAEETREVYEFLANSARIWGAALL
jgi:hypothetical protein